jgi:hypothetical protein
MAGVAEKTVKGPDGRVWEVGRLWFHRMPRRYKRKRFNENALEFADIGGAIEHPVAFIAIIAVVIVLVLGWMFLVPAMILLVDLLFILVVAGLGVATRVLFRRPWKVVAESDDLPAQRFEIPVVGYRAAGAKVDEIAYQIQETGTPFRA